MSDHDLAASKPSLMKQVLMLIAALVIVYTASALGAIGSMNAPVFYRELNLPSFAPPAWWFGPVWTVLYGLMAISAWLVWRQWFQNPAAANGLKLFMVQLALNALWSWLFFAWYLGAIAFVEIILLWLTIVLTLVSFWRVSRWAVLLMLPYLAWVTFAAALSFSIWQQNPGVL